jgi:hypothetical protein
VEIGDDGRTTMGTVSLSSVMGERLVWEVDLMVRYGRTVVKYLRGEDESLMKFVVVVMLVLYGCRLVELGEADRKCE